MNDAIWFTRRERQVLLMLCQANANKQIAAKWDRSESYVKQVVSRLLRRLHLRDRNELTIWCLQHEEAIHLGHTREVGLHPAGCGCSSGYCSSMRRIKAA